MDPAPGDALMFPLLGGALRAVAAVPRPRRPQRLPGRGARARALERPAHRRWPPHPRSLRALLRGRARPEPSRRRGHRPRCPVRARPTTRRIRRGAAAPGPGWPMMVTARGSVLGVLQWQSAYVVRYAASAPGDALMFPLLRARQKSPKREGFRVRSERPRSKRRNGLPAHD
jgi:hypothetical protein